MKLKHLSLLLTVLASTYSVPSGANCEGIFETNRNGSIALENYRQQNSRNFGSYEEHLGQRFSSKFPAQSWLDSGAGFASASLEGIVEGKVMRAVAINTQDALTKIKGKDYAWFKQNKGNFGTGSITLSYSSSDTFLNAMIDPESGIFKPTAVQIFVDEAATIIDRLEKSKKFHYWVGTTQERLAEMNEHFSVITDLFGAYFYSADRNTLLDSYYGHQEPEGTTLIVFKARDVKLEYNHKLRQHVTQVTEYGPISTVKLKNGQKQPLEDYLIQRYPTVFSRYKGEEENSSRYTMHDILVMQHDPKLEKLDLSTTLTIKKVTYGKKGMEEQIPNVVFEEI